MRAVLNAHDLKRLTDATRKTLANNIGRPTYDFIRFEFSKANSNVTAISTDCYILSVEHSVCSEVDEDFVAYIKPQLPPVKSKYDDAIITIKDKTCLVEIGDCGITYKQPEGEYLDWKESAKQVDKKPVFRIGFNGNLLLKALEEVKASCGNTLRRPVILNFYGSLSPAVMCTNDDDFKLVLPVRISEKEGN